ncbi:MAG: HAMP domain-containing protein [Calditrichaeota bacterium]|nr:MAG: HAMP domain-containing protein [Calditrichota bacterium]
MPVLIKWLAFILLFVLAFAVLLWFRTRKSSRFQSRLTLIFFLFVIIPLFPLTLILGQLLLKSTETFVLPGVEETLTLSLDIFRRQLDERGRHFLQTIDSFSQITPAMLRQSGISYAGTADIRQGVSRDIRMILLPESPSVDRSRFLGMTTQDLLTKAESGDLFLLNNQYFFESVVIKDSTLLFAGIQAPDEIIQAKNRISQTLQRYTTLLYLREKMVEEKTIWLLLIIFLLFIAVLSMLLARKVSLEISNPILQLSSGMKRVGAGDLTHRVEVAAKDEIAYLVDSFNQMTEELRVSHENLQRAERAAAWRDIARQISHEIKNPLTPIEFAIYRLESSLPAEVVKLIDLRESMTVIKEEIASIRRIADTFSQFARLPHSELKKQDIGEWIRSSVELFKNNDSGVNVQLKITPNLPQILLDGQQFRSVINNLIKNAIEASQSGETVLVNVQPYSADHYSLRIDVIDHGCGMDEQTQKSIFEPYFTTKTGGSGIGLFLARQIIKDHGGIIEVTSAVRQGSTLTIYL